MAAAWAGAAALLLPTDVQRASIDLTLTSPSTVPASPPARQAPRKPAITAATALLATSKRPLIIAGWGAYEADAREDLIALSDHLGAALSTTLKAKDLFHGHPMDCGLVGSYSHAGGRRLIEQADCIVAFGASLNGRTTSMGTALPNEVPLIHIDRTRASIGRWLTADVAIKADAKLAAQALLASVPVRAQQDKQFQQEPYRRWLDEFDLSKDFTPQHTARTVDARAVALALNAILPLNRNVIYDAGNFLQALPYLTVPNPRSIRQATDFASIGLGIGAAMGYARGNPEATSVLIIGDGGLLMTLGELETVVRENIPLVIVLMNDCAYGAEVHFLKMNNMPTAKTQFVDVDFAPIAAALGFETATIRSMQDLEHVSPMLRNPEGPILIDVKINGAVPVGWLFDDK
jgi:thiamine pyrophosphate-dependent acetolactate synthase large subunit-like protein